MPTRRNYQEKNWKYKTIKAFLVWKGMNCYIAGFRRITPEYNKSSES